MSALRETCTDRENDAGRVLHPVKALFTARNTLVIASEESIGKPNAGHAITGTEPRAMAIPGISSFSVTTPSELQSPMHAMTGTGVCVAVGVGGGNWVWVEQRSCGSHAQRRGSAVRPRYAVNGRQRVIRTMFGVPGASDTWSLRLTGAGPGSGAGRAGPNFLEPSLDAA